MDPCCWEWHKWVFIYMYTHIYTNTCKTRGWRLFVSWSGKFWLQLLRGMSSWKHAWIWHHMWSLSVFSVQRWGYCFCFCFCHRALTQYLNIIEQIQSKGGWLRGLSSMFFKCIQMFLNEVKVVNYSCLEINEILMLLRIDTCID